MTTGLTGKQKRSAQEALEYVAGKGGAGMKPVLGIALLLVLVICSALAVIYSSYKSRQLFAELQELNAQEVQLEEEWGRLLLEQSTWASHVRVEQLARTELQMVVPDSSNIVVVEQWRE